MRMPRSGLRRKENNHHVQATHHRRRIRRHAAADALLLASHTQEPVLLTWAGQEVWVEPSDTLALVEGLLEGHFVDRAQQAPLVFLTAPEGAFQGFAA